VLIGWDEAGVARIAMPVGIAARRSMPEPFKAIDTRSVYRQALMDEEALGAYAQGTSLVSWAWPTGIAAAAASR
jgi:NAD+ diphosphatase